MSYSDKQYQIMSKAEELFAAQGYDGTSVRQIADAAGVNLAMISYYFGSKEKLIEAIVDSKTEVIRMKVDQMLLDDKRSSLDKMLELVDDYVNKLVCNGGFTRLMISDNVLRQNPSIQSALMNLKKKNAKAIQELIKQGQERKEFVENIDTPLLMSTLVGTITHALTSKAFYYSFHNIKVSKKDPDDHIKATLSKHLKHVLKLILTNEQ